MPVDRTAAQAGIRQRPGTRALRTRQRILDATASLLGEIPYRELTTTVVTQRVELRPPAFYRYFADINEAVLELTARMRSSADALAELVRTSSWAGESALASALDLVDGFSAFWAQHRPLYRMTDLLADEGDVRFRRVKQDTFAELTVAVTDQIARHQSAGNHPDDVDPFTAACVVVAALIHTMARESAFGLAGVRPAALRQHLARMVAIAVTGQLPPRP